MKKYISRIVAVAFCIFSYSCNEWLTIQPKTELTAEDMFKTKGGFRDALIGSYIEMGKCYKIEAGITSGFIEHIACQWQGVVKDSKEDLMNMHEYEYLDKDITDVFKTLYASITGFNLLLEYIENGVLDEFLYKETKAQALAARAYLHFDLIRLWGPMPQARDNTKRYLPYVTKLQITPYNYETYDDYMAKLLADLDMAEQLLAYKKGDVNGEMSAANVPYIKYNGILALQARVALWMGLKEKARNYAMKIYAPQDLVTTNPYRLATIVDVNNGDYNFSTEHIFHHKINSRTTNNLENLITYPEYLRDELFANSPTDIRYLLWKEKAYVEGQLPSMKIKKYDAPAKDLGDKTEAVISVPYIRLAEIYLILIETLETDEANEVYKKLCEARNCTYVPFLGTQREDLLIREYRREFVAEGQLFFAYKRLGVKYMPGCANIVSGVPAYVLPLPKRETDVNN